MAQITKRWLYHCHADDTPENRKNVNSFVDFIMTDEDMDSVELYINKALNKNKETIIVFDVYYEGRNPPKIDIKAATQRFTGLIDSGFKMILYDWYTYAYKKDRYV